MSLLKGTAPAPQIVIPQWGHLGNGSQFMRNLDKTLRHELSMEYHEQKKRDEVARQIARVRGLRKVNGLGQEVAHIPARNFFRAMQQHGEECFGDKQFVKEWLRDNPSHRAQS